MFLFLLFDVFDSAYKNGFADGFSAVVLIRAAGPYEVDRFENQISDCWCLPEAIRRRIIALLPPIRDYATQSFQSRVPAWQNSVSELETMVRRGEFDTFALFRKMPIRASCLAFLHAGWFGKD